MIQYHTRPFKLNEVKLEVTYRCDLNCVHCSSDAGPSNLVEMTREDCLRILEQAAQMGATEVAFSGGEPLLWPHIHDAVNTATTSGLQVTIYTSGNTDAFEETAERLHGLDAKRFIFSVFGASAASHERVTRVAGSFGRTLTAMSGAREIGLATEVHFVPMSDNYRELKDIVALSTQRGASVTSVLRLVPQGRAALLGGRVMNRVQNMELRRLIRDLRKSGHDIRTGSPYNFLMLSTDPKCCAAIDRIIIGADLRLYPCDAFKQVRAEELVGTLEHSELGTSTLQDCWDKSSYLEAVREYLTTPFAHRCESCRLLEKCLSGCLAQKVVASGNLDKRPDPHCLGPNLQGDQA